MGSVTTISISIPWDLLDDLDRIQETTRRTRSSLFNQALREFIDRVDKESQEGEEENG